MLSRSKTALLWQSGFFKRYVFILFDNHEEVAGFDALTSLDMNLTHDTIHRRGDGGFHLHRFGDDDGVALLDRGAFFDEEFTTEPESVAPTSPGTSLSAFLEVFADSAT